MILNGSIRNFGQYTDAQLEQMKTDLGIRMPLPKLKLCAQYYSRTALRDPFIEELRFLDAFVAKAAPSPSSVAPRELLTNNAFVAKTYADLMEKRRVLNPGSQKPCSLQEAFDMMGNYLFRIGKPVYNTTETLIPEDLSATPGLSESPDVLSMKNVGCGFRRAFLKRMPFDATDILAVLSPKKSLTAPEKAIAFNAFLANNSHMSAIKDIRAVGEHGVLYEALCMTGGLRIDLTGLASGGDAPIELSALVSEYHGHYLCRIANNAYQFLSQAAIGVGLSLLPFAVIDKTNTVTVAEGQHPMLGWNTDFIRSLYEFTPVSMHLRDESANDAAPILREQHSVGVSAYLSESEKEAPKTLSSYNGTVYTTAFCQPSSSFFFNAIDTVLSTVLHACALGIPFSEQRLAIELSLPFELDQDCNASDAMSCILGLYRTEAELAIPMTVGKIFTHSKLSSPALSVFNLAQGKETPDRLSSAEHRLYCVAPEYEDTGLINFEKLRVFLNLLTETAKRGTIKSARVISRKSIRDALAEMETDAVTAVLNENAGSKMLPLAILLETDEEINATCIGYTQERVVKEADENEPAILQIEEKPCLIWSLQPSVVICALPDDRDAQVLAVRLTKQGAKVRLYTPDADWRGVASALLRSQTLILGKGATLPDRPEIAFAVETLARANGLLLCLDPQKESKNEHPFLCLRALSEEMVDLICKNINN